MAAGAFPLAAGRLRASRFGAQGLARLPLSFSFPLPRPTCTLRPYLPHLPYLPYDDQVGVVLTPIIQNQPIALEALREKMLAVDGNGELYQFLALIRLRDGTPLRDAHGRVTSHLSGLFFRTTRLIAEYGLRLVFVFDGAPPSRKAATLEKRREIKRQFEREHAEALARGDLAEAYSKATMTSRLTREMVGEARELLRLLGLPTVQAPAEGEAQAAHMAQKPDVWAAASKDYDTLMFGAPRLVRFLTISGKEFLPSAGTFRPIVPEIIELQRQLDAWQITRTQLVDLAILIGTDFNEGVRGIGPKKALRLVQAHGRIEDMPADIRDAVGDPSEVRDIYLHPAVTDEYSMQFGQPDVDGVIRFLCDERLFSRERVTAALERAFPPNGGAETAARLPF
jgi:flap endonuclease-1